MPNGGTDNCFFCIFHIKLKKSEQKELKTWTDCYCNIRKKLISSPAYTYCANFHTHCKDPQGPIFSYGIYSEGDWRIPYFNNHEPLIGIDGECIICRKKFNNGIQIKDNDKFMNFCSCKHYTMWYKQYYPEELLFWDCTADINNERETRLKIYDNAIGIDPKNMQALMNKGILLLEQDLKEMALKYFETIIDIDPDNALAWNNRGYCLQMLDKLDQAIKCYERALEINPEYVQAKNNLRNLIKE